MGVAVGEVKYLYHLSAVRMRVFTAGPWAIVIHTAMIVGKKKGTWRRNYDIVAVLVDTKVFRNEGGRPNPKTPGKAFNIALVEYGARSLTAVGAIQAIRSSEDLIMKAVNGSVELARVCLL